jgi:hypothetical protein
VPRMLRRRPSPAMAVAVTALFAALGGSGYAAATITDDAVRKSGLAQVGGTVERFSFLAAKGTIERPILDLEGVRLRAGCDSDGHLRVRVDVTGPGQIQSASTHTTDTDEDAFNETLADFPGGLVDLLPARTNNQLGHTEVARQNGRSVSITWQADNPGAGWRESSSNTIRHQCVFTGNAVLGG